MDEYIPGKNSNKRNRDESGLDPVESKRVHTEPNEALVELEVTHNSSSSNPASRISSPEFDENDADVDSPEAKQIREDILDILDDPEEVTDGVPEIDQELDFVIKSFEEEILHPSTQSPHHNTVDLTLSNSGESQSDLDYLLEASVNELGLPPTVSPHIDTESRLANTIGFENELLRYDSFDLGMLAGIMEGDNYVGENDGDYVTVGGLFDYPDPLKIFGVVGVPTGFVDR